MHELIARLALRTGIAPDVLADTDPLLFTALVAKAGY